MEDELRGASQGGLRMLRLAKGSVVVLAHSDAAFRPSLTRHSRHFIDGQELFVRGRLVSLLVQSV